METISDWVHYFGGADFMPRQHCIVPDAEWGPWIGISATANMLIALSYLVIPWMLTKEARRQKRSPLQSYAAFSMASFFVLCSTTHMLDAASFWWAPYRARAIVEMAQVLAAMSIAATSPIVVRALMGGYFADGQDR